MKTFVEIHVLQKITLRAILTAMTPARQKMLFGGRRRARISGVSVLSGQFAGIARKKCRLVRKSDKRIMDDLKERLAPKLSQKKGFSNENLRRPLKRP